MKTLQVNFETMIGEAIGIAVMNGVGGREIAAELRRLADITEQRADEIQQQIGAIVAANQAAMQQQAANGAPQAEEDDV